MMQSQQWYKVNTAPNKQPVLHEYFGKTEGHYLSIQERSDEISIARVFGEATVFWRFTFDGRMSRLFFRVMEKGCNPPYGFIMHSTDKKNYWNEGLACHWPLPPQSRCISEEMMSLSAQEQYRKLHSLIQGDLASYFVAPSPPNPQTQRRAGQLPLQRIFSNKRLCKTLEHVVCLSPELKVVNEHQMHIHYAPKKNSSEEFLSLFAHHRDERIKQ